MQRKSTSKRVGKGLVIEALAVIVWKVAAAIGHAVAEILMGRQP